MKRVLAWHWRIVGPYVAVVIAFVAATFFGTRHIEQKSCHILKENRVVLQKVITTSTSGETLDFTKVEGFDDLDPASQVFWRNLSAMIAQSSPTQQKRLLDSIPNIDC